MIISKPMEFKISSCGKDMEEKDDDWGWFDSDLADACRSDDLEDFLWVTDWKRKVFVIRPQKVLCQVVFSNAVRCAEALLVLKKVPTLTTVDINAPIRDEGFCAIHAVAFLLKHPSMTELLLYYGASPDTPYTPANSTKKKKVASFVKHTANMLPLEIALWMLANDDTVSYATEWTLNHSIYTLIAILCLPDTQNALETVALLAGKTSSTEDIFIQYAKQGKVIEFAALLMVAPERLSNAIDVVRQHFDSINLIDDKELCEKVKAMQDLLEVFNRAGGAILAYIKQDKFYVDCFKTFDDVTGLLQDAGFQVQQPLDADFEEYTWYSPDEFKRLTAPYNVARCLDDFGMSHYGKSGYRWKASRKDPWLRDLDLEGYINELRTEVEGLKEENCDVKKKQRLSEGINEVMHSLPITPEPILRIQMDEELRSALEKDDEKKFISVISSKLNLFRSRQLLCDVCVFGSIKCAVSLLTTETPLSVDLDTPCPETGIYPLHCAALSLVPSITELFLYYRAQTNIRFKPCRQVDILPNHLVEESTNKLPLHLALLGISSCPCIREWTPMHSIYKLLTILCLPRMQNPLETLCLLVGTTNEIEQEFTQLATDLKLVELAALLMVAYEQLDDVAYSFYNRYLNMVKDISDKVKREKVESGILLFRAFSFAGLWLNDYIKEDKYDVTKHQAVEDVTCILRARDLSVHDSDTNISDYKWYCDEEPSYPREAPYENIRISHDVGMAHYGRTRCRWKVSKKIMKTWRLEKAEAYICELECLKEEKMREKEEREKVDGRSTVVVKESVSGMSGKRPRSSWEHPHTLIKCKNCELGTCGDMHGHDAE